MISKTPDSSLRTLLIAELCNPDWISVPLVGWSHSQALARRTRAHLVTHVRNRTHVRDAGLREGVDFTAIEPAISDRVKDRLCTLLGVPADSHKGLQTRTAIDALTYFDFEAQIWRRFGRAIAGGEYDIVHRLTPLSPVVPSLLARRCHRAGVPFVLGPLNGGVPWPKQFRNLRVQHREWLSYFRYLSKLMPGYQATRRYASAIVVASAAAHAEIDPRFREKTVYIPENGIDPSRFSSMAFDSARTALPLRVVFVGRLVPVKGADFVIEAAASLARAGKLELEIIGDGPEMASLQSLAEKTQAGGAIRFSGWIPHRELQKRMADAHLFAFPSVREFGGAVVLEAMATGIVPIVVDYGGPGELVSDESGFRVPMGTRDEVVRGLRAVFEKVVNVPTTLTDMRQHARARVARNFTWDAKAAQMLEVYHWVLGRRDKPDFGMPFPDAPSLAAIGHQETGLTGRFQNDAVSHLAPVVARS